MGAVTRQALSPFILRRHPATRVTGAAVAALYDRKRDSVRPRRVAGAELAVEFFEKYRLQNVGTTRARLAELISIFETERHALTIRELHDLRDEMDELTEKLRAGRDD